MFVTMKVGSVVSIPLVSGWVLTSDKPAVVAVQMTANTAVIQGKAAGGAKLTLTLASDLSVTLGVNVVA